MNKIILITLSLFIAISLNAQKTDIYKRPVQYERDRDFDAIHYKLELDVDLSGKKLTGKNTITLSPLRNDFKEVILDAVSLVVKFVGPMR